MRNLRLAAIGVVAGGVISLGGVSFATAQTDETTRLEIGTVAEELDLNEETGRELAPLLEELNAAFERRQEHIRQGDEIQEDIATAYEQIAETLTASELREFHWLLREATVGLRAAPYMGRYMMGDGMRGGRGYAGLDTPRRGMRGYVSPRTQGRGVRRPGRLNYRPYRYPDGIDPDS